jgi:predicted permease
MTSMMRRVAYWFRQRKIQAELTAEIEFHRAAHQQALERDGLSPRDADAASRRAMGNVTLAREDARSVWMGLSAEGLLQDVRYGARALWKSRAFTAVAVLTLALGIGGGAMMFSVVNGVLLRPLPYRDPGGVVMLWTVDPSRGVHEAGTSFPTFNDWRGQIRSFDDLAIWQGHAVDLTGTDAPERVMGALVSANAFTLLGVAPRLGRAFSPDEEERRDLVVVLSHRLWQRRFGGAADAVGKTLDMNGRPFRIVGIMPDGFYFPTKDAQFWQPSRLYGLGVQKPIVAERSWTNRYNDLWRVVGRLKSGIEVRDAQAEMTAIGRRLAATHPSPSPDFVGFDVEVVPMLVQVTGRTLQLGLWVLMGAVGFVLLIACANVANLLLARGVAREREFAVRAALGAGRRRLLRQLAIENGLLAAAAAALGIAGAAAGVRLLAASATPGIPRLDEIAVDSRVLAFTASISLLASLFFGAVPAWRLSSGEAGDTLKQSGVASGGTAARRTRRLLVAAECALAVVLLAGAGLLIRSLALVRSVAPGFDPGRVLLVRVNLPLPPSPQWRKQEWAMFQDMEARIAAIPAVARVGAIQNFLNPANPEEAITVEGSPVAGSDMLVNVTDTTPGFFDAMGVPLLRGRFFMPHEQNGLVTIVNESFARRFFPGLDPIGRRFKEGGPNAKGIWYTIVGITGDMHRQGLERNPLPEFFYCSSEPTMEIVVRTHGDPRTAAPAVHEAIHAVYRQALILNTSTVEDTLGDLSAQRRFQTWLLTVFAAIALALAAIGTYGVVYFAVAHRTREIGIRMALGARGSDVVRLVMGQGMIAAFLGTATGLLGALWLTRIMRHLLYRVSPGDPVTFGAVAGLLTAVALVACWFPARRAVRVDPLAALRDE